jgi:hypothetical protein
MTTARGTRMYLVPHPTQIWIERFVFATTFTLPLLYSL